MKFQTLAKKQCLTIDLKHANDLGPSKFRTGAKNNKEQVCDYNFLAVRKETSTDAIIFSIANSNNNMTHKDESEKSPNFFQDNNAIKKNTKPYMTTKIKSRSFLSNISYVGFNKEKFYNQSFVFDIYAMMTKNLNSFLLDRK